MEGRCDMREATSVMQEATCDMPQATCNKREVTCEKRHATSDMQQARSNKRNATSDMQVQTYIVWKTWQDLQDTIIIINKYKPVILIIIIYFCFDLFAIKMYKKNKASIHKATCNKREATSDMQQPRSNKREATSEKRHATSEKQQVRSDMQQAKSNKRHATSEKQQATVQATPVFGTVA